MYKTRHSPGVGYDCRGLGSCTKQLARRKQQQQPPEEEEGEEEEG